MTLRLLAACAVLCSGCTCGIALCLVDRDCGLGGTCDPATGVCINEAGSGGDGGEDGGFDGGGFDGGGFDGGGFDGGTSITIRVPPIKARPADGGLVYEDFPVAWGRGDQPLIWIEASRPLTDVSLKVGGVDAVPSAAAACVEPCFGNCYCFAADLSMPPLPGLRGSLPLFAAGIDAELKRVTAAGALNVTRLSWRRALGQSIRTTPAIGVDGTVYVGTTGGATSRNGSLFAISSTGQERWNKPLGRIDASVLVTAPGTAPQQLFVGAVANLATLTAFDATGAQVAQCVLTKDDELEASAAAIASGAAFYSNRTKQLIAFRPTLNPACVARQMSEDVRFPDSLVALKESIYFVDDKPSVHRYDLTTAGWVAYSQTQWPGVPLTSYRNRGLAVSTAGKLVGSGEMMTAGTVFQAPLSGSFTFDYGFAALRVSGSAKGPVVASDGLVLVGVPSGIAAVSSVATEVGAGDRIVNSPALGEGGRLYALAEGGALSEWTYAGGKPVRGWSDALEATGPLAFEASPALDCARTASGTIIPGRPGILYAAARTGTLYAITVDARGIDTTAQWPKYQKDPRNSGTTDTGLQEFACP